MAVREPITNAADYGTAGSLAVRLAASRAETDAAQALRYRVFYGEGGARPSPLMRLTGRDVDQFDRGCSHLLVIDRALGGGRVVGTCRLRRREMARTGGGFYTAGEYDIGPLEAHPGEILEIGRSCVDRAYRTGPTMQLLWRGIAAYGSRHRVGLMFGCASLPGTDTQALALPLSYLYHHHLAPWALRPRALEDRRVAMALCPAERIDPHRAHAALPPLIKGYLRLGGFVGDGAVVDRQFGTTDVCVVVKTDLLTNRYVRHFGAVAGADLLEARVG